MSILRKDVFKQNNNKYYIVKVPIINFDSLINIDFYNGEVPTSDVLKKYIVNNIFQTYLIYNNEYTAQDILNNIEIIEYDTCECIAFHIFDNEKIEKIDFNDNDKSRNIFQNIK